MSGANNFHQAVLEMVGDKSVFLEKKSVHEDDKQDYEAVVYHRIQDDQNQNDALALTRWRAKC